MQPLALQLPNVHRLHRNRLPTSCALFAYQITRVCISMKVEIFNLECHSERNCASRSDCVTGCNLQSVTEYSWLSNVTRLYIDYTSTSDLVIKLSPLESPAYRRWPIGIYSRLTVGLRIRRSTFQYCGLHNVETPFVLQFFFENKRLMLKQNSRT